VSWSGYQKHLQAQHAPAPLSLAEEELKLIKQTEVMFFHTQAHALIVLSFRFCFKCVCVYVCVCVCVCYCVCVFESFFQHNNQCVKQCVGMGWRFGTLLLIFTSFKLFFQHGGISSDGALIFLFVVSKHHSLGAVCDLADKSGCDFAFTLCCVCYR
jgi:hypothetical protein